MNSTMLDKLAAAALSLNSFKQKVCGAEADLSVL